MSKLTLNDIESLLVNPYKKDTEVEQLIYYYAALKEKLENFDNQSWFFKKGIENHKKDLQGYKERFNELRAKINNVQQE